MNKIFERYTRAVNSKPIVKRDHTKNGEYIVFKGSAGRDGNTPRKGIDYYTEAEINELIGQIQSKIVVPSVDINELKRDATKRLREMLIELEIEPAYIRDLLERLKGDERLDAKAIKNIDKYSKTQLIGVGGGANLNGRVYFWGIYSSDPSVAADNGDEYYNSSEELLYKYINGVWVAISGGTVVGDDNFVFEDGNNFIFEDGNNFTYET